MIKWDESVSMVSVFVVCVIFGLSAYNPKTNENKYILGIQEGIRPGFC